MIFLPPYSPELKVGEGLCKWLKSEIINNVFYHTAAEIRKNVQTFMKNINHMTVIDWLCIRMESSAIQENLHFNLYRLKAALR
ncbi:hypothetical protein BCI9360_00134 [Bacillus sp. CECT 9360]|nr:hypothetical protein BCI9360_00134 [Bacillus sp. CECT 9360]